MTSRAAPRSVLAADLEAVADENRVSSLCHRINQSCRRFDPRDVSSVECVDVALLEHEAFVSCLRDLADRVDVAWRGLQGVDALVPLSQNLHGFPLGPRGTRKKGGLAQLPIAPPGSVSRTSRPPMVGQFA